MVTTNDRSIQNILDEVWKQTDQYIQSNKGIDFNVFESLGIEDKEVPMCRMLAELLNQRECTVRERCFWKSSANAY